MVDWICKNSVCVLVNNSYDVIDISGIILFVLICFGNVIGCSLVECVSLDIWEWVGNFVNVNSVVNFYFFLFNVVGIIMCGENNLFIIIIIWSEIDWDVIDIF